MFDAVATALVFATGGAIVSVLLRQSPKDERRLLGLALLMHFVASLALKYSMGNVYSEGDVYYFREAANPLVELMRREPLRYVPATFGATFHVPSDALPFDEFSSTLSMVTATALGRLVTFDSMWALYAILGFFSFLGKWGIYAAFRDELGFADKRHIGAATLFLPSAVFWSAGLVKEAFAIIGLGALLQGTRRVLKGKLTGLALTLVGGALVGAFKPYILFPFAVGIGAWVFLERSKRARRHAPVFFLVGGVLGYGLVVGLSAAFPQFSPTGLAERTASMQVLGAEAGGGSYYGIAETAPTTISGQIAYAPLALATTLTRPLLFEVHNAPSAVAALEMTLLTGILVAACARGGAPALRAIVATPIAVFALVFVLLSGVAIGLATTNFGTLSRYRVPIMPFYAVLVAITYDRRPTKARATTKQGTATKLPLVVRRRIEAARMSQTRGKASP